MDGSRTTRGERESIFHIGCQKLHRKENVERRAERGDPYGSEEGGKVRGKLNIFSKLSHERKTKQERTLGDGRRYRIVRKHRQSLSGEKQIMQMFLGKQRGMLKKATTSS